ncbi:MAG: hypothetical protein IJ764_00195 [Bacteroidales bacterium]|nr:hypothetical protein [Bacteroidales bacterium]
MSFVHKVFAWLLKEFEVSLFFYNTFYRLKNKKKFWSAIKGREALSIFDYEALSEDIPFYPLEKIKDTNYYGHAYVIKEYSGSKKFIFSLEHGLYYDGYVSFAEKRKTTKRIMTISDVRKSALEKVVAKPIVSIGPYIHYATPTLDEKSIAELKQQLGKVLLFFPSHSCTENNSRFDVDSLIARIQEFANQYRFDTIIVNMYFLDIQETDYAEKYFKAGFRITTAGHQNDINFIRRLKTIINLADYTIANSVGTHLGYCIYMGKPHCIIDSKQTEMMNSVQIKEIGRTFYNYHETITEEQYNIVSQYWGFNCIKTSEEMYWLLKDGK